MDSLLSIFSHPALSGLAAVCTIISFFLSLSKSKFWYLFAFCIFIFCATYILGNIHLNDKKIIFPPDEANLLPIGKITEIKHGYVLFNSDSVMPNDPLLYIKLKNNDIVHIILSKQKDNIFSAIVPKRINEINENDIVLISR
ncbi:hypothetical protein [Desulfosarcina ovata]|uniref:Uncharacterized protein n=1 Tax=Desulfosarcina ovata subsp. ovata TaxID=2752305 RepID=A0A5K8AHE9_9BACT|nr:hypothetical protein [Desulfosarcina ovata]BBO91978.1 hypothetical protein DSCOOX_51580 [Desulfosarcina ovata subsp. ovata]